MSDGGKAPRGSMTVRRSLGVVTGTRMVVFLFDFASVIIVSRLLTPREIGIFSISVALVGVAHVLRDFGVGQYLIQLKHAGEAQRRAAFSVTLAVAWLLAGAIFALRTPAASFYGHAGVADVLALVALNFVLLPIGAPLRSILQREMQFGKLATISLMHHAAQAIATVTAALLGASYMSMAWGSVTGTLVNVLVTIWMSPSGALVRPTWRGWRDVVRFGSRASTANIAVELGHGAPDLILGRTLGFEAVGLFSRAAGLVAALLKQLLYVAKSVYVPAFAKGLREGRDGAADYCTATQLLTGATVPAIAVLAWIAPDLVLFLFGTAWAAAAPLAQLLCAFALLSAPFAMADASLTASGRVGWLLRVRLSTELVRVAVLLVSLYAGLLVVVVLLVTVHVVEALLFTRALRVAIGLGFGQLVRSIWRSYVVGTLTLLGPAALWLALAAYDMALPHLWKLVLATALATVGWLLAVWAMQHPVAAEIARAATALRRVVSRKRGD